MSDFHDVLEANRRYAGSFALESLTGRAAREIAVLTCIDSRIEPLAMLGLQPGDAKIVRNAGARVTDDALRSLSLASHLLGARRIMVIAHTDCAMAGCDDVALRQRLVESAQRNGDSLGAAADIPLGTALDQLATLESDFDRLCNSGLLPSGTAVGSFLYDVHQGTLRQVGSSCVTQGSEPSPTGIARS